MLENEKGECTWELNSFAEMAARAAVRPAENAQAYPFLFLASIAASDQTFGFKRFPHKATRFWLSYDFYKF